MCAVCAIDMATVRADDLVDITDYCLCRARRVFADNPNGHCSSNTQDSSLPLSISSFFFLNFLGVWVARGMRPARIRCNRAEAGSSRELAGRVFGERRRQLAR